MQLLSALRRARSSDPSSTPLLPELVSSLVVFLVALPLCVGIAVASGVPITAGILSGVIGGVVIGAVSGSPLLVSGPAAALAVMVYELVQRLGLDALGPIVLLAGAIQLACGRLGLGQWFRAVSPPVLHGLLGGIGVLVMSSQVQIALGRPPSGSGMRDLAALPGIAAELMAGADPAIWQAAALAAGTFVVIALAYALGSPVPPTLVGVLVGTGAAWHFGSVAPRLDLPGSLLDEVSWFGVDSLLRLGDPEIWAAGMALALVASAETLLCASALDQLHDGEGTEYDQELVAQGLGNVLCGLVGALPSVGLIVRSTANIEYGARTRLPAMLHGVWILLAVLVAPQALEAVPVAVLAGLLIWVGWKLAAKVPLARLRSYGRSEVAIYLATLGAILGLGLLRGVALGVGLSVLKLLVTFAHLEVRVETSEGRTDLHLDGAATFLQLPRLGRALRAIPANHEAHLHLHDLDYVDHACLELLTVWAARHERRGAEVVVEWDELSGLYHLRNRRIDGDSGATEAARVA